MAGRRCPWPPSTGWRPCTGSAPDVGVVGYTLGGGVGWLGRRYGLAANSVTAIELVTAAGEPVRADAETEPDLFWALRGGGGNFGVVTALEFRLYPVDSLNAGWLVWPWEEARRVLAAGRSGPRPCPTRSPRSGGSCSCRPCPTCPRPSAGASSWSSTRRSSRTRTRPPASWRPCASWAPSSTPSPRCPATALSELHMDPPEPVPAAADGCRHRRVPARGGRRPGGRRRPRLGLPAGHRRAPPHRRRARAGARRRGRPRPHRRPLPGLRGRHRDVPGGGRRRRRGGGAGERGHVASGARAGRS